jgi:hypothetical protein
VIVLSDQLLLCKIDGQEFCRRTMAGVHLAIGMNYSSGARCINCKSICISQLCLNPKSSTLAIHSVHSIYLSVSDTHYLLYCCRLTLVYQIHNRYPVNHVSLYVSLFFGPISVHININDLRSVRSKFSQSEYLLATLLCFW